MNDYSTTSMRECHLGHQVYTGCWCGETGRKHRVILSCCIFGQNGAVQIEHLYEEECKTAQAGSALPWSVACHKNCLSKCNEKAYGTTNGLDGLEFLIDPVRSAQLLDWHHVFRPRNWCQIAVLPSLLLEAPSDGTIPEWWLFVYLWILVIFTLIWED